ncbi:polysaccharide pyruvyl transferase family protein [Virgibacillus sp. L01]|uniref:polysaccharide pyruvyl transferase family protein n=1 Tax=Virgibacillus sp. L01 TaxID=3457429 RepID=UPI003FD2283B
MDVKISKVMAELKKKLNVINSVIPTGSTVYYFDYPVYGNLGDLLIWKGTEKFFSENNIIVKKRYSNYESIRKLESNIKIKIPRDATIVCQGGGNFGDLYNDFQKLRKLLVSNYPSHRIVFLPQTIYYMDPKKMEEDFKLFRSHKDLHVYTRDEKSFTLAKSSLMNTYLCPDMAHSLYPIIETSQPVPMSNKLYFIRQDKERVESQVSLVEKHSSIFDWHLLFSPKEKKILNMYKIIHRSSKVAKVTPNFLIPRLWSLYVSYLIKKAIVLYSQHKTIITSRLHGHILACLMNKSNVLIDNSYGKNLSYYQCWTKYEENVTFIDHFEFEKKYGNGGSPND